MSSLEKNQLMQQSRCAGPESDSDTGTSNALVFAVCRLIVKDRARCRNRLEE